MTDTKNTVNDSPTTTDPVNDSVPVKRKRGRPRKSDIEAKKKRNKVGRPLGEAGIMKEYKARMLNSPRSQLILDEIMTAALDDGHKHQSVAWKIWADRVIPVSMFEKEVDPNGGSARPMINITIGSAVDVKANNDDVIDGELDESN